MVAPLREGFREVGRGPIIPKLWTDLTWGCLLFAEQVEDAIETCGLVGLVSNSSGLSLRPSASLVVKPNKGA